MNEFPMHRTTAEAIAAMGEDFVRRLARHQEAIMDREERSKMMEAAVDIQAQLDTFIELLSTMGPTKELHDIAWGVQTRASSLWFSLRNRLVPHCPACGGEVKANGKS